MNKKMAECDTTLLYAQILGFDQCVCIDLAVSFYSYSPITSKWMGLQKSWLMFA